MCSPKLPCARPRDAKEILAGVDKYFAKDAIIVHPMLNSPASSGREGVKAAYKMLRVLTLNQKVRPVQGPEELRVADGLLFAAQIQFNAIGFDRIVMRQGQECRTALIGAWSDPAGDAGSELTPRDRSYRKPSAPLHPTPRVSEPGKLQNIYSSGEKEQTTY